MFFKAPARSLNLISKVELLVQVQSHLLHIYKKKKLMDKCFAQTCPSVPLSVRHSTPCRLVHLQEPVFKIWKGAQAKEITHCLLVLDSITIFSRSSNTIPVHKINSPEVGCGKS